MDGVTYANSEQSLNIKGVHDMVVQIKTDNVVGSETYPHYLLLDFMGWGLWVETLTISFSDPMKYRFTKCHDELEFPTANFPTYARKIWSISLTNEPDIVITVDVNGVRVAEMSADFCDKEGWELGWEIFDIKETEIDVITSTGDMIDGYKVVVKEGNYMNYFKLNISNLCSSLP